MEHSIVMKYEIHYIIIDSSLAWSDHIDYIFNKLLKFVGIFYKLGFKLSSEILQQLYFAFIYPYISYGIEIYANACYSHLKSWFYWITRSYELSKQEVKVIWQKAPHGGPIPRLGVTPGGRKLYHWIPGVRFPISVP